MRTRKELRNEWPNSRWEMWQNGGAGDERSKRARAAMLLVRTRQSYGEIAEATGFTVRTLCYWAKLIEKGQLARVLWPTRGRSGGRKTEIEGAVKRRLVARLSKEVVPANRDLRRWLENEFGIELTSQAMHYWIRKLKPAVPKPKRKRNIYW